MSQGLMTLIGGVLIFLATIIPVVMSILRWAMQKGVPTLALMAACFALVGFAFYATAFIGVFRKWNINLIFSLLFVYVICYTATFLVPIGVPTRFEIVSLVISFTTLVGLVAVAISRAPK